jgi:hypothetical protein
MDYGEQDWFTRQLPESCRGTRLVFVGQHSILASPTQKGHEQKGHEQEVHA